MASHAPPSRARESKAAEPIRARPAQAPRPRCLGPAAQLAAVHRVVGGPSRRREEPGKPNRTGLPDRLKAGVEALSGLAMDDVRVRRNSAEPAKLGALAYAQGTDIHLGSGQERHLPHEAWHVVQQKQGRVRATLRMKGVGIDENQALEREADQFGAAALSQTAPGAAPAPRRAASRSSDPPVQRTLELFHPDAAPSSGDMGQLHLMAKTLDGHTKAGLAYLTKGLTALDKGAKFDRTLFPDSSQNRCIDFSNRLLREDAAAKAMTAGYIIEDYVTKRVENVQGLEPQTVLMAGGRPDFRVRYGNRVGVVDITSEGQRGHIWDKAGVSKASFDYIAECTYPNILFGEGTKFELSPESQIAAKAILVTKAHEHVATWMTNTKNQVEGMTTSAYPLAVQEAAIPLRQTLKKIRSGTIGAETVAQVDREIDALNLARTNTVMTGRRALVLAPVAVERMSVALTAIRDKFGLLGYPVEWVAPEPPASWLETVKNWPWWKIVKVAAVTAMVVGAYYAS